MSYKGSQVAFVLQEKSKLSRISEAEWHRVNGGVDETVTGKGEFSKNTQKDNVVSRLISENCKHRRGRRGNWGARVFSLSQWTQ